jgi:uncharacterized protein (DUF1015 family)
MAKIYPFRGLRYAADRVSVEKVVTQPYDKISREMQQQYYELHPQNIVRIVFGKQAAEDSEGSNVYTRAANFLRRWKREGILVPLDQPAIAVYFQKFVLPGTDEQRLRKGFIAVGQLEDYSRGIVFPHERTLSGPKRDRLELLRHTRTQFEQIFMLYEDPEQQIDKHLDDVASNPPDIEVKDEYRVVHQLWFVFDPDRMNRIQAEMSEKKLIIADGHHRYETALAYRDEMRAAHGVDSQNPWERMPMTFFNMHSPGLAILPTHRVLSQLTAFDAKELLRLAAEFFQIAEAPADPASFRKALTKSGASHLTVGVATKAGNFLLSLKEPADDPLDVAVLHGLIIEKCLGISEEAVKKESHIRYEREFDVAVRLVWSGEANVAFLLNATKLEQLRDRAYAGEVMPQKSTDFYPKVLSGLWMYEM